VIFSVWAPNADSADLILGEQRFPLEPLADGYWQIDVAADPRQGYRYSIDGAAPMPDPRSRWQPEGVHGASHVIAAEALGPLEAEPRGNGEFQPVPLGEAIIYELHVGTFTP